MTTETRLLDYSDARPSPASVKKRIRYSGTPAERFWPRVDKSGDCWLWTGCRRADGYGKFGLDGKSVYAHRWSYEQEHGPVPKGMHLDHLCRNPSCVRPSHLDCVTPQVNILRGVGVSARQAKKAECDYGHPFTPENTQTTKAGHRRCRTCNRRLYREADIRRGRSRSAA